MADTNNNTQVNVDIGASAGYKGVVQGAMKDFGGLWSKIAEGGLATGVATAGVVALAVGVGAAVKQAGDYQEAIVRLSTSAGESQKNLKLVSEGVKKVAVDTGTSLSQLTDAMYVIESGGQHGADGLKVLTAAAEGAKTEGAELKTVADAVTSILQDYHLKASDSADVTSKLVAAVGAGKTTFQELAGSLHSVLPVASAAHISMSDILGDIASMTVHGMSADQATQNLANAIRTLQSPSQSAQQYLAQLGINAADLNDKLSSKGLSGTLQDISQAIMNKMGPSGKVLIDSFNQSKSAAADATKMIDSMPKSLQEVAKQFAEGKISLADYRKEIKSLPVDQANLMQQFATLENHAKGFNNLLKSGSPEALSYSQALQKATGNATTMNVALMLTGENAKYTNDAIKTVSATTTEAGGHVKGWAEIQKNFNQQLSQWRERLQVAAVTVGQTLLPALTWLLRELGRLLTFLQPIANFVIRTFAPAFRDLAKAIQTDLMPIIESHKQGLEQLLKVIAFIVAVPLVMFIAALYATIKVATIIIAVVSDMIKILEKVIDVFMAINKAIMSAFIGAGSWLFNVGKEIVQGLINGVKSMASAAGNAVKDVGKSAVDGLKGMLGIHSPSIVFAEIGTNMGQGLVQGLQGIQAKTNVAVNALVTGSNLVNSNGSAASSVTNSNTTNNYTQGGGTHNNTFYVTITSAAAAQQFFRQINQDSLNVGRGLSPVQGAY